MPAATDGLDAAWSQLTVGAAAAGRLSAQLAEHDRLVGVAAEQGRAAKYKTAIATLDEAAAAIAESRKLRDRIVASVDVTVLDQWLDRNEAYDKALAGLYTALASVGGKVTKKVRAAIAAEKAARARLPPDARGLVVIMADIGRGSLNRAVIAIEGAKAALADALEPVERAAPSRAGPPSRADPAARYTARSPSWIRVGPGSSTAYTNVSEARASCRSVSSTTSRGMSPRTCWSSRSSTSRRSRDHSTSSIVGSAASSERSPHSASSRPSATRRRWPRPARSGPDGSSLIGAGDAAKLDRETVVRIGGGGRAPARRPRRSVGSRSGWRRSIDALGVPTEAVAELVARGVVEGSYDPKSIYLEAAEAAPPDARRADPRRARPILGQRGAWRPAGPSVG